MKKIYYFIIGMAILFSGCEGLLDVKPSASYDVADGIITTRQKAELALNGMYDGLQNANYFGLYMITYADLAADNLDHTGTYTQNAEVDQNAILTNNNLIAGIWDQVYYVINISNNLIEYVPSIENMNQTDADRIVGEALFVRGLSYFCLVENWGGVPMQLKPVTKIDDVEKLSRETVANLYTQIEADLNLAVTKLGDFYENGRTNAWAAKALLSRVHLYQGEYQLAFNFANDVIENGPYQMVENYEDLFDYERPYTTESIFEIDFTDQDNNNLAFWNFPDGLGGRLEFAPAESLIESCPDIRLIVNVGYYEDEYGDGYLYNQKYKDVGSGSDNVFILRLAEMYLTRAEALINGAVGPDTSVDDFNQTHVRAGNDAVTSTITMQDILDERWFEFAFEGQRWYDLVRTGEAATVLGIGTDQYLWPIPQDERDMNTNLTQNPGY